MKIKKSIQEPRIVLFEASHHGHHPFYITLLIEYWLRHRPAGILYVVVSPEFADAHPDVIGLASEADSTGVHYVIYSREESATLKTAVASRTIPLSALLNSAVDPEEHSCQQWKLFCSYAAALKATHGLLMYFDACYVPVASGMEAPCPFLGIYFKPSFYYQDAFIDASNPLEKIQKLQEKFTLVRILRHPQLQTLFCLDPYAIEQIGKTFYDRFVYLPDPVRIGGEPDANKAFVKKYLGIEENRQVFLLFGELSPRKGITPLLAALRQLPPAACQRICLMIVGPVNAINQSVLENLLKAVADTQPIQIIRRDEHIPEAEISWYFHASDVILAPYQRHIGMSGVLLLAAAHRRPVLCQDYGLMGALTRKFSLGLTVDTTAPEHIAEGLNRFLDEPAHNLISQEKMNEFVQQHTAEAFTEVLFRRLLSASWKNYALSPNHPPMAGTNRPFEPYLMERGHRKG